MAAATATRKRKTQELSMPDGTKLAVKFGNVGMGDATATVRVTVNREVLNPIAADEMLCGKRLRVLMVLGAGVDPAQRDFWDDVRYRVSATVDVKSYGVDPKNVKFGLTFNLTEVEDQPIAKFAKKEGCLVVEEVMNIPASDRGEDDDEDDNDLPLIGDDEEGEE